ncbi:hypothetical protein BOTBODRAFT_50921 [Botryobasidium botryosum FD-172 SS1]|uniref:UspA domain-containing protein n=1 Tax=Botryobasidium botryosum (strain FD-172 SS1) TaxID=930990 RepID=A0A067MZ58_BOTB1|nr:hypothetical protein BOTBODRAFT_50921 [Botryobasidium botryosum FD-172 SS1]
MTEKSSRRRSWAFGTKLSLTSSPLKSKGWPLESTLEEKPEPIEISRPISSPQPFQEPFPPKLPSRPTPARQSSSRPHSPDSSTPRLFRTLSNTGVSRFFGSSKLTRTTSINPQASDLILNAITRTTSHPVQPSNRAPDSLAQVPTPPPASVSTSSLGPLGKFTNLMSFPSLSTSRDKVDGEDRGRGKKKEKHGEKEKKEPRSSSLSFPKDKDEDDRRPRSLSRTRRGQSGRSPSPAVSALRANVGEESDNESIRSNRHRVRNSAFAGTDDEDDSSESDDDSWGDDEPLHNLTEANTEHNALLSSPQESMFEEFPDPLGEGVNVVRPAEPMFAAPTPLRKPNRKKSLRSEGLILDTSRPQFQRDRCTVIMTHGDPAGYLASKGKEQGRRYVVASDLSEESKYAVEWAIGTVLRDGDEMIVVNVQETDSKLDPVDPTSADRVAKLRNQQERQGLAFLLVRQVTSLLQRTKLHVSITCQAIHAKNSRKMLVDVVDYTEPTMLIVGSRGMGKLKGILLGSTSHYLIQKSSVPVMVARRRLKRPARRTAHLDPNNGPRRVSLAEAAIDKAGPGRVDKDVENMRSEMEKEEIGRAIAHGER